MNTEDLVLPELSDIRIDEIEEALFAEIARERGREADAQRTTASRRARRLRRTWLLGGAAAAVIVVAAVITPSVQNLVAGSAADTSTTEAGDAPLAPLPDRPGGLAGADGSGSTESAPDAGQEGDTDASREVIATASATVRVDDAAAAAEKIGAAAEAAGGYVEAMSVGGGPDAVVKDEYDDGVSSPSVSGAWISVRVPADRLTELTRALADVGEVTNSQIDRRDVTTEAIDLRARVDALEASVSRLTELLDASSSTSDLLAAETALAERQAELESYRQQLTYLENQVGMSTLTVTLVEPQPVAAADPAGFGDGIAAGWSGLVATLNGIVVALGFLLPWLAVAAVAGVVVWLVRRLVRRRKTPPTATDAAE